MTQSLSQTPSTGSIRFHGLLAAAFRSASALTIMLQLLRYAINLGVSMCLARLISPADFGLNGMAMVFLSLMLLFKDAGLETSMVARKAIPEVDIARLTTFSLLFSLGLTLLCAGLAPVLGWLYGEPRLLAPILAMSVAFFIHGLALQPGIRLLRDARFRTHACIEFSSVVACLLVALVLAWKGAGLWALFSMEITASLVLLIGFWSCSGWKPRFRTDWREAASYISEGRNLSISRVAGHAARNIDQFIMGLSLGPIPCAFYGKAYRLVGLPQEAINWPLSRMAVSALGSTRDSAKGFVAEFKRFNLISAGLGMPLVVVFVLSTENIVTVLYGSQWTQVVPLVRALGILGFLNTFLLGASWVYAARGTTRRQIPWEILNLVAITFAFVIGVKWGALGVACAASLVYALLRIPSLLYCFKGTPLRISDLGSALWRPALASGLAGFLGLCIHFLVSQDLGALCALTADSTAVLLGYALGWICVPGWKSCLADLSAREVPETIR